MLYIFFATKKGVVRQRKKGTSHNASYHPHLPHSTYYHYTQQNRTHINIMSSHIRFVCHTYYNITYNVKAYKKRI